MVGVELGEFGVEGVVVVDEFIQHCRKREKVRGVVDGVFAILV